MIAFEKKNPSFFVGILFVQVSHHFRQLGMSDEQIRHVSRRGWRRKVRTHQPEPRVFIRRVWDVLLCASYMKDPERPGHMFLREDWLDFTKKELKYAQLGFLSDSSRFPLYEVIGRFSTGLRIYRDLRQTSCVEGYNQHKSRAVSVHARGAGGTYHALRQDIFDWFWGYHALVKANKIPDPGTSWFWVVDMVSQVLRDHPEARPPLIQAWPNIDTTALPILGRGIYAEANAPSTQPGQIESRLLNPKDLDAVLQHPHLVAQADAVGLQRATGFFFLPFARYYNITLVIFFCLRLRGSAESTA